MENFLDSTGSVAGISDFDITQQGTDVLGRPQVLLPIYIYARSVVPYECILFANRLIVHLRKRNAAEEQGDSVRADYHRERLQHKHDAFNSLMTAVMRTEGRLGLTHTPKEGEIGILMVREFRQMNAVPNADTGVRLECHPRPLILSPRPLLSPLGRDTMLVP